MANVYQQTYTAAQHRLVKQGRVKLQKMWLAAPYNSGQTEEFSVSEPEVLMNAAGNVDRFTLIHAAPKLDESWYAQKDCAIETGSRRGTYHVDVSHAYYLRDQRTISCDLQCCAVVSLWLSVAAGSLYVAMQMYE